MCPVTFTAVAVSAGLSATTAAVVGTAVSGALIGVAANGAMNIATGQSFFKGAGLSALMGGATAGIGQGITNASVNAAVSSGNSAVIQAGNTASQAAFQSGATAAAAQSAALSAQTAALSTSVANTGLASMSLAQAGSTVGGQLASGTGIAFSSAGSSALRSITPEFAKYTPQLAQAFNPAESKITGSGGTQAAGVLAASIQAVKKRRERQTLTGDVGLGTFTNTGLQFA